MPPCSGRGRLLAKAGFNDPMATALCGMATAALVGLVFGSSMLRTKGLAFLVLSMAAAFLLHELANKASYWTGGDTRRHRERHQASG